MSYKKQMGQRIKCRRKELRLTQENIAEYLDISVKHYSEAERGLAGLSIENLIKLSALFDLSIDYIVKGDHVDNPWYSTLLLLQSVPNDKIPYVKELIKNGVELAK